MAARLLILLLPLVATAQVEEIPIRLTTPTYVKPESYNVLCEIDGTYFHIPRSWLTKEIVITAPNGIKLGLPWQAGQCEATEEWTTRSE